MANMSAAQRARQRHGLRGGGAWRRMGAKGGKEGSSLQGVTAVSDALGLFAVAVRALSPTWAYERLTPSQRLPHWAIPTLPPSPTHLGVGEVDALHVQHLQLRQPRHHRQHLRPR